MCNDCLKVLIYYILQLDIIYKVFPKKMLMHVVKGINCENDDHLNKNVWCSICVKEKGKQLSDVLCWDIWSLGVWCNLWFWVFVKGSTKITCN
jgi:hypothetical protein